MNHLQIKKNKTEKVNKITQLVTQGIKNSCNCFSILEANLKCFTEKSAVTYRAILYSNDPSTPSGDLVEDIADWVSSVGEVQVLNTTLKLDANCKVKIEKSDEESCDPPQSSGHTGSDSAAVAASVTIILIFVAVFLVLIIIGGVFIYRKRVKSNEFRMFQ